MRSLDEAKMAVQQKLISPRRQLDVQMRSKKYGTKAHGLRKFVFHFAVAFVLPISLADPDFPIGGYLPLPFPFPPLSFPSPFPSLLLEVGLLNTARGRGSAVSSPSGNRIWCILALKSDIWWHQFY